ncbi:MAG: hypothetical protein ACRKFN_14995 [Desulfitobacterium sp.]
MAETINPVAAAIAKTRPKYPSKLIAVPKYMPMIPANMVTTTDIIVFDICILFLSHVILLMRII